MHESKIDFEIVSTEVDSRPFHYIHLEIIVFKMPVFFSRLPTLVQLIAFESSYLEFSFVIRIFSL